MKKQSIEFRNAMDETFGNGLWKFSNFTYDTIAFTSPRHLPKALRSRIIKRYQLDLDDVLAYNDKPGLATDKSALYKPLTDERIAQVKPALRALANI